MITRVRCPGCCLFLKFDEDRNDGDGTIEMHTMTECHSPDAVVSARVNVRRDAARARKEKQEAWEKARDRSHDTQPTSPFDR